MISDNPKATVQDTFLLSSSEPAEVGAGLGNGRIERRLVALLALDIKNYSAMISLDEVGAHKRVGKGLALVVREIHRHGGRILQFSGDGLLAEFSSACATLQSALHIQSAARKRNRRRSVGNQIEYRIGINTGDIVVQGCRIGGDTV